MSERHKERERERERDTDRDKAKQTDKVIGYRQRDTE